MGHRVYGFCTLVFLILKQVVMVFQKYIGPSFSSSWIYWNRNLKMVTSIFDFRLSSNLNSLLDYVYTFHVFCVIWVIFVLVLNAVYCGFHPSSCQTKVYDIDICGFSTRHTALRSKISKIKDLFGSGVGITFLSDTSVDLKNVTQHVDLEQNRWLYGNELCGV